MTRPGLKVESSSKPQITTHSPFCGSICRVRSFKFTLQTICGSCGMTRHRQSVPLFQRALLAFRTAYGAIPHSASSAFGSQVCGRGLHLRQSSKNLLAQAYFCRGPQHKMLPNQRKRFHSSPSSLSPQLGQLEMPLIGTSELATCGCNSKEPALYDMAGCE